MLDPEELEYAHRWLRKFVAQLRRKEEARAYYAKLEKKKPCRLASKPKPVKSAESFEKF